MKAVVITRFGGPEVLELQDVPRPQPGPNEILVHVRSTALNRADLLQRQGRYAAPPGAAENIPGLEFAGEVVDLGADARRWNKGGRVMGIVGGGAHAEFLTTPQDAVCAVPSNLESSATSAVPSNLESSATSAVPSNLESSATSAVPSNLESSAADAWAAAGAIPEVFITAHDALHQAGFKRGENVLVHAVGSGVGLAATQLVRALGGHAFGTSRTPDKIERAKAYGLESGYVVPEPSALQGLADFAKCVTNGRGVDVVLDLNGGPYFAASLEAMALRGRIILIGGVAGGKSEVDLYQILGKRLHVIGTVLRARSLEEKIAITTTFAREVVPLLANESIKPVIDSVFPLEEIQDAHRRLESNETFGKVVLTIS